jgi:hypothetical protein
MVRCDKHDRAAGQILGLQGAMEAQRAEPTIFRSEWEVSFSKQSPLLVDTTSQPQGRFECEL